MYKRLTLTEPDRFGLLPLWEAIYSIYDDFAAICNRHGLRYYALGGTLLGAVRHHGFIPWDDDLDVAMPRADYERFVEIARTELPESLRFVYWKNTPEFPFLYGKLQDVRKSVVDEIEAKLGHPLQNGIFIDIFPLDGYPSLIIRQSIRIKHRICCWVHSYKNNKFIRLSLRQKISWIVGFFASFAFPKLYSMQDIRRINDKDAQIKSFDGSEYVADVSLFQDIFKFPAQKKRSWGMGHDGNFNGQTMRLPDDPTDPLESRFGAHYMTPPPAIKQTPAHSWGNRRPWCFGPTLNGC